MPLRLFDDCISAFERFGRALNDVSAFVLLALPPAAILLFFVLRLTVRRARGLPRGWAMPFCDACLLALTALFLIGGERETLLSFLALALADRAACTLLYALLFVPLRREKRSKKEKRKPRAEEFFDLQGEEPSLSEQPNKPAMVRCYAEEDRVSVEKDVRLGHIFSVLERLKDLPLGAGDRLETEKFREMLEVYRAKGDLTAKEVETLNDILASLLKMMAKYDV